MRWTVSTLVFLLASLVFLPTVRGSTLLEVLSDPEIEAQFNRITRSLPTLNHLTVLHNGQKSYDARIELIRTSRNFIFTFMPFWHSDETGISILNEYEMKRGRLGVAPDIWTLLDLTTPFLIVSGPFVHYLSDGMTL